MPSALVATATLPDAITFVLAAVIVVAGATGVVVMKNPVHSALMLVMTLFGTAVLFVEQNAQFLAAVQVIVYAGAIVVLFLFVIMLLGVDRHEEVFSDTFTGQRFFALFVGVCVLAEVIFLGSHNWTTGAPSVSGAVSSSTTTNINLIGDSLFTTYLLPFEVTSALLVVAVLAAVVLARRHDVPQEIDRPEIEPEAEVAEPEEQVR